MNLELHTFITILEHAYESMSKGLFIPSVMGADGLKFVPVSTRQNKAESDWTEFRQKFCNLRLRKKLPFWWGNKCPFYPLMEKNFAT